jgi:AraC family transcriptional regulator, transcriptional activator of pobA
MAKTRILHFDGLYGDLAKNTKEAYIFLELIKTRSETFDWVIKPHIHSHLYQVFCIESGHVILDSSEYSTSVKTPGIAIIPPGTMHGLQYSPNVKGYILTLSDSEFEELFSTASTLSFHFDTAQTILFSSRKQEFRKLMELIKQINTELFSEQAEKSLLLKALLSQFFITLLRLSETSEGNKLQDTNKTLQHYRKFIQSVKNTGSPKAISTYAKETGISSVHLNRICNQVCGKSALLIVQEHLIQQSKNYLAHSSYSIAEIAYLLNFEYPNYFARLFKKLHGISPKEYRKSKR